MDVRRQHALPMSSPLETRWAAHRPEKLASNYRRIRCEPRNPRGYANGMMLDEVARILADERCVVFAGSGVSTSPPSSLISAHRAASVFLRRAAVGVAEAAEVDELLERRGVLPEFIYGLAERHFGQHVYDVWKSLEFWKEYPGVFSANASHLAMIHIAARSHTPILTPNFDSFFESAARRLNLIPQVAVATPGEPFQPAPILPGSVAIWKLHGNAAQPETIFSSVRTLTRPIPNLHEKLREAVPKSARLVFAGYSGRDMDLFPVLAEIARVCPTVWVDVRFGATHRARVLNPAAIEVVAPFDAVARKYASFADDDRLAVAIRNTDAISRSTLHNQELPKLEWRVERVFKNTVDTLRDEAGRRLLFGELFINAGMSRSAVSVLESGLSKGGASSAQNSERARLLAKAYWELGEFKSSEAVAKSRLRRGVSPAEKDALRFAVTAAKVRALMPPSGLPGTAPPPRRRLLLPIISAVSSFLCAAFRATHAGRVPEPTRTPLVEGWVEHGIRIMAAFQLSLCGPNERVSRLTRRGLVRVWNALRRSAQHIGYAEGVGNSGRYLARLVEDVGDGSRTAHEFLGHFLGVAIAHRDAAGRALLTGDLALARKEFDRGVEIARLQDDPVLLLSFVPLAEDLGVSFDVDEALVARIEADWARAYLKWVQRSGRSGKSAPWSGP